MLASSRSSLSVYQALLNEKMAQSASFDEEKINIDELKELFRMFEFKFDTQSLHEFLRKSFNLFDNEKNDEIDLNDARTIIYDLKLCPTEAQMNLILKELALASANKNARKIFKSNRMPKEMNKVKYGTFSSVMMPILAFGKCGSKSNEVICKALKLLANLHSGSNRIDLNKFEEDMCSGSENRLKFEEFETFKDFAEPFVIKGNFNFEEYLKYLQIEFVPESFLLDAKFFKQNLILKELGFKFK